MHDWPASIVRALWRIVVEDRCVEDTLAVLEGVAGLPKEIGVSSGEEAG